MASLMPIFLSVLQIAVGIALVIAAPALSRRYNAWTTQLRERNRHINPPPTDAMRTLNTKIMTIFLRVFGVGLILISVLELFWMLHSK
jgi:hypothetical protein